MTTLDVGGDQWQREDLDSGLGPSGGQFNSNSFDLISKEVFFFAIKKIPIYLMNRIRWQSKTQRTQLVLRCLAGSYSFNFLNWWWNLNVFQLIWCNFVVVIGRLSPSLVLVFLRRCDPAGTSQWAAAPLNWVSETEPTASPRQRRKIRHQPPTSLRPFRNFMLSELLLFDFG